MLDQLVYSRAGPIAGCTVPHWVQASTGEGGEKGDAGRLCGGRHGASKTMVYAKGTFA